MRRLFWLAIGVTIGATLMRKLSKLATTLTPRGLAQGIGAALSDLAYSARDFAVEIREAMAERDAERRERDAEQQRAGDRAAA